MVIMSLKKKKNVILISSYGIKTPERQKVILATY